MEKKSTHKLLCFLSGGVFLIHTGYVLINNVMAWVDYFTLTSFLFGILWILGRGMIGIGLATEKRKIILCGSGIAIAHIVFVLVRNIIYYINLIGYYDWSDIAAVLIGFVVGNLIAAAPCGILAYMAHTGSKQIVLPILAGVIAAISPILNIIDGSGFDWLNIVVVVEMTLAGFALIEMVTEKPVNTYAVTQNAKQSAGMDKVEKLQRLKTLLDIGAINQEEFEQKKKEIINA